MKNTPDETAITLWIDGKLAGDELAQMEAWAKNQPELLAERDAIRAMNSQIADTIPASEEPPYPDFFNQRILRDIEEETSVVAPTKSVKEKLNIWRWLAIPAAAAAMTACFYMGLRSGAQTGSGSPTIATTPTVYTPDENVRAAMFTANSADATVIVLEGLNDIPDSYDIVAISETYQGKKDNEVMVTTGQTY